MVVRDGDRKGLIQTKALNHRNVADRGPPLPGGQVGRNEKEGDGYARDKRPADLRDSFLQDGGANFKCERTVLHSMMYPDGVPNRLTHRYDMPNLLRFVVENRQRVLKMRSGVLPVVVEVTPFQRAIVHVARDDMTDHSRE